MTLSQNQETKELNSNKTLKKRSLVKTATGYGLGSPSILTVPHERKGLGFAVTHTSVSSFLFRSSFLSFSASFSAWPAWTSCNRLWTSSSILSTYHRTEGMRAGVCPTRPSVRPQPAWPSAHRTHHLEHPGPISCILVHSDPLVGHGLAEAHLATGVSLGKWGCAECCIPGPPASPPLPGPQPWALPLAHSAPGPQEGCF